jgi:branched-chain amino acid transport system ATP-binding protein
MSEVLLDVQNLRVGYGQDSVLHDVSLAIPPGGSLAVLGRNGVGKSTLMLALTGHLRARTGHITLRGNDVTRMPAHRRVAAGIGWVPQERETFPSLTVDEHLAIAVRPGHWTRDRVYELFPRLRERSRNLGWQLSGGEQQMLAIARALVTNPVLLLLDEPLEGLAPVVVEDLAARIRSLMDEESTSIVIVEQHASFALNIAKDAIVIERGRIVHRGPSEALRGNVELLDRLVGMRRFRDVEAEAEAETET